MKFKFTADIAFEATDMDDAIGKFVAHFEKMWTIVLSDDDRVFEKTAWFKGKMVLVNDDGDGVNVEGVM